MYSLISTNQVLVKAANKHIMENHTITKYNEVNIFILMGRSSGAIATKKDATEQNI